MFAVTRKELALYQYQLKGHTQIDERRTKVGRNLSIIRNRRWKTYLEFLGLHGL